jgi:hypothetical protein
MRLCYRIAAVRRQVKRLVAIAAERAVRAERRRCAEIRAHSSFRPLTESETEAILGDNLLAALSDTRHRAWFWRETCERLFISVRAGMSGAGSFVLGCGTGRCAGHEARLAVRQR